MKKVIFRALENYAYPHIYFFPSPFKIYEYWAIKRVARLDDTMRVLDIGCGHGLQTRLMASQASQVVGIDVREGAIGWAKSLQALGQRGDRCTFKQARVEELDFPDNYFDRILSVCVLEHVPDDDSVLQTCFRLMKPGGQLVFSVDSLATVRDEALKQLHSKQYDVCRYYSAKDIEEKMRCAGFRDVNIHPLMCSTIAASWFELAIARGFKFRYSEAIWRYWFLRMVEPFAQRQEGLYLMAEARKM